ncbi:hypothetical protein PF011_g24988 [Phytophthora fragariae]|uniref:Uncharacterized protein n=1 Tax=Phytophthora fragariae TaxID=53985 RepID=A0A6A3I1T2_9STRA|nr:hypothetical protein PF011_g24988 [Phytophthora fragariae]
MVGSLLPVLRVPGPALSSILVVAGCPEAVASRFAFRALAFAALDRLGPWVLKPSPAFAPPTGSIWCCALSCCASLWTLINCSVCAAFGVGSSGSTLSSCNVVVGDCGVLAINDWISSSAD